METALTLEQQEALEIESRRAGLNLAQTMGGYGALAGLAISGMYNPENTKRWAYGAVSGLVIGLVGGYFAGSIQAKRIYTKYPDMIPYSLPPGSPVEGGMEFRFDENPL